VRLSRCEVRDHIIPQKRSLALVSILQSLAAAEIANALHLRDFRSPAIFEFFNTIGAKRTLARAARSEECQQATLQAWLETKETTNRGARFDELLRVVRVKLTAEQCRTLASIAAAARDDRGLDDLVAGRGRRSRREPPAVPIVGGDDVIKWGRRRLSRGSSRRRPIGLPHRGQSLGEPTHC
jgi:hypothetical protein